MGFHYNGNANQTRNETPCQRWDSQTPTVTTTLIRILKGQLKRPEKRNCAASIMAAIGVNASINITSFKFSYHTKVILHVPPVNIVEVEGLKSQVYINIDAVR